jgi:hypothetical protein
MQSARYLCPILTKLGISRRMFVEVPSIKFNVNPPSESHADIWGQMEGRITASYYAWFQASAAK